MKIVPPQEASSRYPTTSGQVQQSITPIPTVVYIDGPIANAPAWPKPSNLAIEQKNFQFVPSLLVVSKGTSVAFPNEDSEFHNVFSYSKAKRFDLGRYPKGESKNVFFDTPGIVKIYCEVHPWMRAVVLVLENPFFAVVAANGTFAIRGIPAGHYDLVIWNIDAGSKKVGVDVTAGNDPVVRIQLSGRFEAEGVARVMTPNAPAAGALDPANPHGKGACCAGKR
jgi:plastocyanin